MNFSAIISVLLYIHFLYVDGLAVWIALLSLTLLDRLFAFLSASYN